jgi:hypothetical protein
MNISVREVSIIITNAFVIYAEIIFIVCLAYLHLSVYFLYVKIHKKLTLSKTRERIMS